MLNRGGVATYFFGWGGGRRSGKFHNFGKRVAGQKWPKERDILYEVLKELSMAS